MTSTLSAAPDGATAPLTHVQQLQAFLPWLTEHQHLIVSVGPSTSSISSLTLFLHTDTLDAARQLRRTVPWTSGPTDFTNRANSDRQWSVATGQAFGGRVVIISNEPVTA